ncbi:hypothetical protein EJ08DRAFT_645877 [Tothia fuscella]|uniref:HMG box domain-containing protein n=1 Tax=Tothia fuscella TaxID=1048955 RepID=A0A9P4P2S1_9PEZI|nr:hypothetical protein EJ08DRAFT_645877 [Tothia fuscella]
MTSIPIQTNKPEFISRDDFLRTRDSVVSGLTTLTSAVNSLITAYITHTDQLLNGGAAVREGLDTSAVTNFLTGGGLATSGGPAKKEKKKRVKKEKDPNAPKRPLTAFFLYSTNARNVVKNDLGATATPVLVNDEILRRWKSMDEAGKKQWKDIYEKNNEKYKQEVLAYKAQTGKDLTVDVEADEEELPNPEELADAQAAAEETSEEEEESEEEIPAKPPTPVKTKTPKAKKGKANGATAVPIPGSPSPSAQLAQKETPIPLPDESPAKAGPEKRKKGAKEPSPEGPKKKKARKSKGGVEQTPEVVTPSDKKEKKKKRKSEGF